jgi:hypothetical protein
VNRIADCVDKALTDEHRVELADQVPRIPLGTPLVATFRAPPTHAIDCVLVLISESVNKDLKKDVERCSRIRAAEVTRSIVLFRSPDRLLKCVIGDTFRADRLVAERPSLVVLAHHHFLGEAHEVNFTRVRTDAVRPHPSFSHRRG